MSAELTAESIGMNSISPSKLQSYMDCPLAFYYGYWLGIQLPDQDKLHLDFGNAVQDSIEKIYSMYDYQFGNAWEAEQHRFPEIRDYFLKAWTIHQVPESTFQKYMQTRAGKESGFTSREELYQYFKNDGLAILKSYWSEKETLIAEHELDLDEFEIKLWVDMVNPADPKEKLPIPLSGRIDAKNRSLTRLIDFKTSSGRYNAEESRKLIQCRAYPFGYLMQTGKFIPKFDYVVLRKGLVREERIEVVNLEFDMADMLAFYIQVKSILQKIANREFPRGSTGHQNFCDCYKYESLLNVNK